MNNLQHLQERVEYQRGAIERWRNTIARLHAERRGIEEMLRDESEEVQKFVLNRLPAKEVEEMLANGKLESFGSQRIRYNDTFSRESKVQREIDLLEERLVTVVAELAAAEEALKEKVATSNHS